MNCNDARPHDLFCFVCGGHNPYGLQLKFLSSQPGCANTRFVPEAFYQSYDDILHGGIQSLLLDACMVQAVKSLGVECVTGKLDLHYKTPVFLKTDISVSAEIEGRRGLFYVVTAQLKQDLVTKTTARGIYKQREGLKTH